MCCIYSWFYPKNISQAKSLSSSSPSSMCEKLKIQQWQAGDGLCTPFLKSFPALKQAFGHPKCF